MNTAAILDLLLTDVPLTPETPCSYFADRQSRSRAFRASGDLPEELFELALEQGYRRCGDIYYRQECRHCSLCMSYRVVLSDFVASRSQRRVWRRNQDVTCRFVNPRLTDEKQALYLAYQYHQHYMRDRQLPTDSPIHRSDYDETSLLETMRFQMYTNPTRTRELELRIGRRLIGFGNVDVALRSASAVYFVFDPAARERSLGTLGILHGIAWAQRQQLTFYHLGFYLPSHPKMTYKGNFRAADVRHGPGGDWRRLLPGDGVPTTDLYEQADRSA